MALTPTQKSSRLFKKLMGVSETSIDREFFEEPYLSLDEIWAQQNLIPNTAPVLSDGEISGVVQYYENKNMSVISGTADAFYLDILKDAIPFNYGDGSYNYILKNNLDEIIPFGQGDWIIDNISGVLYFYNGNSGNMPPKITFYKYVGTKGITVGTSLTPYTEVFIVDSTIISDGYIDLLNTPSTYDHLFIMYNGLILEEGVTEDFTVLVNRIIFNFTLDIDNKITVKYKY